MASHARPTELEDSARPVGRPRRLSVEQVLDAALATGLDDLNMARLAADLGVGIATIYRCVGGRDQLLRLAAARKARHRSLPVDEGQHWSIFAADFARAVFDLMANEAQLVTRFIEGGLGPEIEAEHAESFVAAMNRRGFAPAEALRMLRAVGQIAVGAAATMVHARALRSAGTSYEAVARGALARGGPEEFPQLHACAAEYCDEAALHDFEETLALMLRGIAASRGEMLP